MSEIYGPGELAQIPDDLTIVQFMQDYEHPNRPVKRNETTWFIEDDTGRKVGFEEIKPHTDALANSLHEKWKLGEDEVVCICSPNHVDYPIVMWASFRLGAIITAANPAYTVEELVYQLRMTQAKLLIVHPANLPIALSAAKSVGLPDDHIILLEPAPAGLLEAKGHVTIPQLVQEGARLPKNFVERKLRPGEGKTKLAFLSFSSGTTGLPKAVKIPHYSLIANVIQISSYNNADTAPWEKKKFRKGDVGIAVLPFYHIYGQVIIMHFQVFYGISVVVVTKFDFLKMLDSIQRHRINFLAFVPPMIVALCKHPATKKYDLSSIRMIASGAAPLSGELMLQVSKLYPQVMIGQGYGMTETSTAISFPQLEQQVGTPGSAGRLLPGVVVRVVREDGSLAPIGQTGELVVKSPSNALGYLNNEAATKDTFRDGWVHTGDEVYVNKKSELFVVDRIKDLIKVKGFQVAPPELEGHLLELSDVSDVCIVGLPDDYSGEVPLAFVVPSAQAAERMKKDPAEAAKIKAAIIKHVADNKVHFKRLTGGVEFIDAVPRNPSGKLLRRVLREKAREMRAKGEVTVKAKL
ncbi:amp dependent CoA ligase [Laetiporus sulphureus 93-53]|uniref:Amp dependent CoA ligase n=1 Tax=Laetiporus sulphureus 93-53 TaxID=1314785 RepID=A0A165D1D5_9APHY|nr:amp dependent CoA ligase [Laetiporus sulphureus 93-53]KZT03949.1 amp dependent CoA ligase [Laetiporus sulphureus 93-53]